MWGNTRLSRFLHQRTGEVGNVTNFGELDQFFNLVVLFVVALPGLVQEHIVRGKLFEPGKAIFALLE